MQNLLSSLWRGRGMEFTYPRVVVDFHKVLVIFPRLAEHRKIAARWVDKIFGALKRKQVEFLDYRDDDAGGVEFADNLSAERQIFSRRDVKFGVWVSPRVIGHLRRKKYTMALDLSPTFDFLTAQIPLRAGIPVRIGFAGDAEGAEKFFNILFRGFEGEYETLVKFLSAKG